MPERQSWIIRVENEIAKLNEQKTQKDEKQEAERGGKKFKIRDGDAFICL